MASEHFKAQRAAHNFAIKGGIESESRQLKSNLNDDRNESDALNSEEEREILDVEFFNKKRLYGGIYAGWE